MGLFKKALPLPREGDVEAVPGEVPVSFAKRPVKGISCAFPGLPSPRKRRLQTFLDGLYAKEWVVYCKPPFNGPGTVLGYLGRYTHRIAITNHRIPAWKKVGSLFPGRIMPTATKQRP